MRKALLAIQGLRVRVQNQEILHGIDLEIRSGEFHVLMGPNGSGKSTLSSVLMGHPRYEVSDGTVQWECENLLKMKPEERARSGLFLSFQHPKEIPGVNLVSFLKASYNAVRTNSTKEGKKDGMWRGEKLTVSLFYFKKMLADKMSLAGMSLGFMNRYLNVGFSGGEKKKCEILQMVLLEPKLAILDEPDSGMDLDAVKDICRVIKALRNPQQSFLLITHNPRILDCVLPDHVHLMVEGKIVKSGGIELAKHIEKEGYVNFMKAKGLKIL